MRHFFGSRKRLLVLGIAALLLWVWVQQAFASSARMFWFNNLKQISIAIENYHDALDCFPDDIRDADGKALLSWRVAILPFVECDALFKEFYPTLSWDHPTNAPRIEKIPKLYIGFSGKGNMYEQKRTNIAMVRGKGTFFGEGGRRTRKDIQGDRSTIIVLVELDPNFAPIWTEPRDWDFDPTNPRKGLASDKSHGCFKEKGCYAVFADGVIRFIPKSIDPELLKRLVSAESTEPVIWKLNWIQAMFRRPIASVLWPVLVFSLIAIVGSVIILIRFVRGRIITPGEMLWLIVGAQQLIYIPMFMIHYRYQLVPTGLVDQHHLEFWFYPRLAGSLMCMFALWLYWRDASWRRFFAIVFGAMSLVTLDAMSPTRGRYPEESLINIAASVVMGIGALMMMIRTWNEKDEKFPGHRLYHWIGMSIALFPFVLFCSWGIQGVVELRGILGPEVRE